MRDVPVLQPTKVFERFRTIRKEVQSRGRIAGDNNPPATDQVIHPVRLDAKCRGELGDCQLSRHTAWAWAPVAVETPPLETNGFDRTGQYARALGRPKPLRGEKLGNLLIRFALGFESQHLGFQLRESSQVVQRADRAGDRQLTDLSSTPHEAGLDRIRCEAMQDHFVNETAQQRFALGSAQGIPLPHGGQRFRRQGERGAPGLEDGEGNDVLGQLRAAGTLLLRLLPGLQGRFPAVFEVVCHETVVRIHPLVTAPGEFCLIHLLEHGGEVDDDGLLHVVGEGSPHVGGLGRHRPHTWAVATNSLTASSERLVGVCPLATGSVALRGRRNWTVSRKHTRRKVPWASGRVGHAATRNRCP
jgi:hypothetical protein